MKTLIFALTVAFTLSSPGNTPPSPEGTQTGRYQITAGTIPSLKGTPTVTVFRIDSATGRVWSLHAVPMRDKSGQDMIVPTWIECHEVNGALYQAAIAAINGK